jgi:DeoR family glycerol-3-phosphate regulon repressor
MLREVGLRKIDDDGLTKRQDAVIRAVRESGFASIESMAERLGVSAQTIRREVIELSRRNLLERYHGGAGLPPGTDKLAYTNRRVRHADEKRRIAAAVARDIPDNSSVFMDIGTTVEAVCEALVGHRGLRIITNHIVVASIFCENTDFEIVLAGGMVRNRDRAVTGEATAEFLRDFRVQYGVFGIGAIDHDGQMLDYDYRDVQVSLVAMEIARQRFVVVDGSKFHGDAMIRFAHVSKIDALYTDAAPPADIAVHLNAGDVRVVVENDNEL